VPRMPTSCRPGEGDNGTAIRKGVEMAVMPAPCRPGDRENGTNMRKDVEIPVKAACGRRRDQRGAGSSARGSRRQRMPGRQVGEVVPWPRGPAAREEEKR